MGLPEKVEIKAEKFENSCYADVAPEQLNTVKRHPAFLAYRTAFKLKEAVKIYTN